MTDREMIEALMAEAAATWGEEAAAQLRALLEAGGSERVEPASPAPVCS